MKLLAGLVEALPLNLVLLRSGAGRIPGASRQIQVNPKRHRGLLAAAQRLRAQVYLADGAIQESEVTPDGRHEQAIDYHCWHFLALDEGDNVCGCLRYRDHANTIQFRQLSVSQAGLAAERNWGKMLQLGVERELAIARRRGMAYAEVGGWAIAPERRRSIDALKLALATYAFAGMAGGARGITTATVRHHSSSILRRLGGKSLVAADRELPPYYDPRYHCEMEVLQFDSGSPSPAYRALVDELRARMPLVPVICGEPAAAVPAIADWLAPAASHADRSARLMSA